MKFQSLAFLLAAVAFSSCSSNNDMMGSTGLGKSKSLKEAACSGDFIADTSMIKAFDAIMTVKISGDVDANAVSPSKGTISSAEALNNTCDGFFAKFETQSCRVGGQTISASEFKATCNRAKMVLRFDPATGNILAFKGSTLNVEFLKNIPLLVGEDDVWVQDGQIYFSEEKVDTARSWCELDTTSLSGGVLASGVYRVTKTETDDSDRQSFNVIVSDPTNTLSEIECNVREASGYLTFEQMNDVIGRNVFKIGLTK